MRTFHVRLRNQKDVDILSKKIGSDVSDIRQLKWEYGLPNLFGDTETITVKRGAYATNENPIDISKFHWKDMPHYQSKNIFPYCYFKLNTNVDTDKLMELFEQGITPKTKSLWYPKLKPKNLLEYAWNSKSNLKPKYPIFIISKGRYDCCYTAQSLDYMGLDYKIVVEPSEVSIYKEIWGDKVITGDFDTTTRSSIPVRNWIDDNTTSNKYWLLDDNIKYFFILNNNIVHRSKTSVIFRIIEDYSERFENVGLVGMNKLGFCKPFESTPPYYMNRRVYSCTLLNKEVNEQVKVDGKLWRGRYNEDTDLNLRILKKGLCTLNFSMFNGDKRTTQTIKGGNNDSVYTDGDNRFQFAQSLVDQHPNYVDMSVKWGRYHHHVKWEKFSQTLIPKKTYPIHDYGIYLEKQENKKIRSGEKNEIK